MSNHSLVEQYLHNLGLHFSHDPTASSHRWLITFSVGTILVLLCEDGEYLLIRSCRLLDIDGLPADKRLSALSKLMQKNDELKLGRYAGNKQVHFEVGLWLASSEVLGRGQFERAFAATYACLDTSKSLHTEVLGETDSNGL